MVNKRVDKKKSTGLQKAITVVSLLMIITGIAFWYPTMTGNAIAQSSKGFIGGGLTLFILGLLGIFLSHRK